MRPRRGFSHSRSGGRCFPGLLTFWEDYCIGKPKVWTFSGQSAQDVRNVTHQGALEFSGKGKLYFEFSPWHFNFESGSPPLCVLVGGPYLGGDLCPPSTFERFPVNFHGRVKLCALLKPRRFVSRAPFCHPRLRADPARNRMHGLNASLPLVILF